jgi:saccharopine dehydrogenase (NADP+, L-glutamate forming)
MKAVLLLGAGKSSIYIIDYLSHYLSSQQWTFVVADLNQKNLAERCESKLCTPVVLPSESTIGEIESLISKSTIVVSMLPPAMHPTVAGFCLQYSVHLITPSYISDQMQSLDEKAKSNDLLFLNEMGLDPGIDHMSIMKAVSDFEPKLGKLKSLKSHCGGLVAKVSDTNLWHYKVSWNPRNVVLAGSGADTIKYRNNNQKVEVSYTDLFTHTTRIQAPSGEIYESYPNRDSLKYEQVYGLNGIETLYRGTLRKPPFCEGWDTLVKFGYTSTIQHFPIVSPSNIENPKVRTMFEELGIFEIKPSSTIAADLLQELIENKWVLSSKDTDSVVMIHELEFEKGRVNYFLEIEGESSLHTAMAKTVGLPIAIACKMMIEGKINERGVVLPISSSLFLPILSELKDFGIEFTEQIEYFN